MYVIYVYEYIKQICKRDHDFFILPVFTELDLFIWINSQLLWLMPIEVWLILRVPKISTTREYFGLYQCDCQLYITSFCPYQNSNYANECLPTSQVVHAGLGIKMSL